MLHQDVGGVRIEYLSQEVHEHVRDQEHEGHNYYEIDRLKID